MSASGNGHVAYGYIHPGTVEEPFLGALLNLQAHDQDHRRILGRRISEVCGGLLAEARNTVHHRFLTGGAEEWLLWFDSDITVEPEAVYQLVDAADPEECPILGGVYFFQMLHDCPTFFVPCFQVETPDGTWRFPELDETHMGPVAAAVWCGTGLMLVHRSVLEKVYEEHADDPWPWFGHDIAPVGIEAGGRLPEDLTFCRRAAAAGFPIGVHTGVVADHVGKPRTIGLADYRRGLSQFRAFRSNLEAEPAR